jgi:hypothetical protein
MLRQSAKVFRLFANSEILIRIKPLYLLPTLVYLSPVAPHPRDRPSFNAIVDVAALPPTPTCGLKPIQSSSKDSPVNLALVRNVRPQMLAGSLAYLAGFRSLRFLFVGYTMPW